MASGTQTHKIRIVARLRPRIDHEPPDNGIKVVRNQFTGPHISVVNQRSQLMTFPFSSCYDQDSTQEEIFNNDVRPLLDVLYNGVTVTIFAYGVTSSGKTHTMQGTSSQPGIIPRVIKELLHREHPQHHQQISFSISYMEIYKDEVYDLLGDRENAHKLPVRESEGQVFVAHLSTIPIASEQDFHSIYSKASKSRSVGSTNLNRASSRSHAILTVHVTIVDNQRQKTLTGKLILVDLAGSENNKLTGNDASRMQESSSINKSLSVLGQVVHSLNLGASRIPYRNSKLTRILQDALGGTSVGLMIINLAPGLKFRQETLNTLNFAVRTKNIENKPVINERDTQPAPNKQHFAAVQQAAMKLAPAILPSLVLEPNFQTRPAQAPQKPSSTPGSSAVPGPGRRSRISMIPVPQNFAPFKEQLPSSSLLPLTEEINEQIAALVKMEVAKELERQEKERLEREEEAKRQQEEANREREEEEEIRKSIEVEPEEVAPDNETREESQPISSGMLEHLLQHHKALDIELMARLEELEKKLPEDEDSRLQSVLSPISRKKTGRAYVSLARQYYDRGHMDISLELFKKAQTYVPDNVKLRDRIIEMEWAVKNNKPYIPSPKPARKGSSKSKKKGKGKRNRSISIDIHEGPKNRIDVDERENDGAFTRGSKVDDSTPSSSRTSGKRKRDPFGQEDTNSPKKKQGGVQGTKVKDESEAETPHKKPRRDQSEQDAIDIVEDRDGDSDEWLPCSPPRKLRGKRNI